MVADGDVRPAEVRVAVVVRGEAAAATVEFALHYYFLVTRLSLVDLSVCDFVFQYHKCVSYIAASTASHRFP